MYYNNSDNGYKSNKAKETLILNTIHTEQNESRARIYSLRSIILEVTVVQI
jgi:hypothetical protein